MRLSDKIATAFVAQVVVGLPVIAWAIDTDVTERLRPETLACGLAVLSGAVFWGTLYALIPHWRRASPARKKRVAVLVISGIVLVTLFQRYGRLVIN